MLIGHFGVALGLKAAAPRTNLGWICLASLWLDLLLWTLVLSGLEQVIISEQYGELHYLQFVFPFSHSVLSTIVWVVLAFVIGRLIWPGPRLPLVMAAAVASHFLLDVIVHPPQLTVAGSRSPHVGLGLWNHLVAALAVEGLIFIIGLVIYYRATRGVTALGRLGPLVLMMLFGGAALFGQATSPTPPSETSVAASSLIMIVAVTALMAWLDTRRRAIV